MPRLDRERPSSLIGYELADGLGDGSPLARLYDLDALVLLLGVGHERNTSLHLAQYRSDTGPRIQQSGPVLVHGERRWVSWPDIDLDADDFPALGVDLEQAGLVRVGTVGQAAARLMEQRTVVDHATRWFRQHHRCSPPERLPAGDE